jgi:hypothetical protein
MFFEEFQEWGGDPYVSRDDHAKLKDLRPAPTEQSAPPQPLPLHPSSESGEPTSPNSLAGDSGAHSRVGREQSQASVPPTQITTESTPAGSISQVMPLPLTSFLSSTV